MTFRNMYNLCLNDFMQYITVTTRLHIQHGGHIINGEHIFTLAVNEYICLTFKTPKVHVSDNFEYMYIVQAQERKKTTWI